jgi:hypothetical protein
MKTDEKYAKLLALSVLYENEGRTGSEDLLPPCRIVKSHHQRRVQAMGHVRVAFVPFD